VSEGPGRWFVAAYPGASARAALAALARPDEPGVRWVPSDRWHVTLCFLGALGVGSAAEATAALAAAELPVAPGRLEGRVGRLGRSALVVPVVGLDGLAGAVAEALAGIHPGAPGRFVGHLTVARLRQRAACGLAGHRVEAALPVEEVALVCSGGEWGPGHHVVSRHACRRS